MHRKRPPSRGNSRRSILSIDDGYTRVARTYIQPRPASSSRCPAGYCTRQSRARKFQASLFFHLFIFLTVQWIICIVQSLRAIGTFVRPYIYSQIAAPNSSVSRDELILPRSHLRKNPRSSAFIILSAQRFSHPCIPLPCNDHFGMNNPVTLYPYSPNPSFRSRRSARLRRGISRVIRCK